MYLHLDDEIVLRESLSNPTKMSVSTAYLLKTLGTEEPYTLSTEEQAFTQDMLDLTYFRYDFDDKKNKDDLIQKI